MADIRNIETIDKLKDFLNEIRALEVASQPGWPDRLTLKPVARGLVKVNVEGGGEYSLWLHQGKSGQYDELALASNETMLRIRDNDVYRGIKFPLRDGINPITHEYQPNEVLIDPKTIRREVFEAPGVKELIAQADQFRAATESQPVIEITIPQKLFATAQKEGLLAVHTKVTERPELKPPVAGAAPQPVVQEAKPAPAPAGAFATLSAIVNSTSMTHGGVSKGDEAEPNYLKFNDRMQGLYDGMREYLNLPQEKRGGSAEEKQVVKVFNDIPGGYQALARNYIQVCMEKGLTMPDAHTMQAVLMYNDAKTEGAVRDFMETQRPQKTSAAQPQMTGEKPIQPQGARDPAQGSRFDVEAYKPQGATGMTDAARKFIYALDKHDATDRPNEKQVIAVRSAHKDVGSPYGNFLAKAYEDVEKARAAGGAAKAHEVVEHYDAQLTRMIVKAAQPGLLPEISPGTLSPEAGALVAGNQKMIERMDAATKAIDVVRRICESPGKDFKKEIDSYEKKFPDIANSLRAAQTELQDRLKNIPTHLHDKAEGMAVKIAVMEKTVGELMNPAKDQPAVKAEPGRPQASNYDENRATEFSLAATRKDLQQPDALSDQFALVAAYNVLQGFTAQSTLGKAVDELKIKDGAANNSQFRFSA